MMKASKKITLYVLASCILVLTEVSFAYMLPYKDTLGSYAFYGTADSSDINELVTVTTSKEEIDIDNTYPMSNEAALRNIEPYYIRITNNSDEYSAEYQVLLEVLEDSAIDDKYISYNIYNDLNNAVNLATNGYYTTYSIYEGVLVSRESLTLPLRIWINESGTTDDILNGEWRAKIVVRSTKKEQSSKLKIITGDINTPGSEVKIGGDNFYLLSNDNGNIRLLSKYGLFIGNKDTWDYTSENTTGALSHKVEAISNNDFNYGRQDERALGITRVLPNGSLDTGMIRSYYGLIEYSDDDHVMLQGECNDSTGVLAPCYSNYNGSILQEKINEYAQLLMSETGITVTGDALSKSDLLALGCSNNNCPTSLSWLYNKTYYLKDSLNSLQVYYLLNTGEISITDYNNLSLCVPVVEFDFIDLNQ